VTALTRQLGDTFQLLLRVDTRAIEQRQSVNFDPVMRDLWHSGRRLFPSTEGEEGDMRPHRRQIGFILLHIALSLILVASVRHYLVCRKLA